MVSELHPVVTKKTAIAEFEYDWLNRRHLLYTLCYSLCSGVPLWKMVVLNGFYGKILRLVHFSDLIL